MNTKMLVLAGAAAALSVSLGAAEADVEAVKAVVKSAYVDGVHAKGTRV